MNNVISVGLFRVSGDSKYLDMIFDCPEDFHFESLHLEVRFLEQGKFKLKFFDLSNALFIDPVTGEIITNKQHWTVRLPLYKLDIFVPAIYIGTLKMAADDESISNPCGCYDPEDNCLTTTMVCSDVNSAYKCMLDDILKEGSCETVSDDAIRKYLLLYGHQAAMAVEDMETAEAYFKLIGNCFNKCAVKDRPAKHAQPCNCGR